MGTAYFSSAPRVATPPLMNNPQSMSYLPTGSPIDMIGLSNIPPGTDPLTKGGRVPNRSTYPFAPVGQPLLEFPQSKLSRITIASNAWLAEPIINSASKLTIFMAFEKMLMTVQTKTEEIPDWIPPEHVAYYSSQYGDKPDKITEAYVKQECLEFTQYLDLKTFFENAGLDVLVAGDQYTNIASNCTPDEENVVMNATPGPEQYAAVQALKKKMIQDGRGEYKIEALQALNPSACWLFPDAFGRIPAAQVIQAPNQIAFDLNVDNLIHQRAFSFPWTTYGVSQYIAALRWVDIKLRLMESMWTQATRYINPVTYLTIEGPKDEGTEAKLPPTEQQMDWGSELISAYAMGQPHVMPGGWDWHMIGAEGKTLKLSDQFEIADDAIRTAAQVSRTFTSGASNVPAYATSKLQAGVMVKAIAPLSNMAARAGMGRILYRYCLMRGFFESDKTTVICPQIQFMTMPIQGDDSIEKKIVALGQLGMLSPITAWEWEGIDPGLEFDRLEMSRQALAEPWSATPPNLGPGGAPDKFSDQNRNMQASLQIARQRQNNHLLKLTSALQQAVRRNDVKLVKKLYKKIQDFDVQANYLRNHNTELSRLVVKQEGFDPKQLQESFKEEHEILRENNGHSKTLEDHSIVIRSTGG